MTIDSPTPIASSARGVALESLHMFSKQMLDYKLMQNCPFSLSKLRFLSTGRWTHVPWSYFVPVVQSIERLDIVVNGLESSLALSSFPNLASLRIPIPFSRASTLQTFFKKLQYLPMNLAERQMDSMLCAMLDIKLSSLPMSPTLVMELEVAQNVYEDIWPFFPSLSSRNAVRISFKKLSSSDGHGFRIAPPN
ncbi:hypothetical protein MSAN_01232400 [Mycena sanguinolenta]|uniref:Uncharacterized protein n=1 Tax=Mycena sanguinolenta TaxID=230812 RepID=A0A8H6YD74_9AGAR|nr:hypothetical protein MSAN_01232400 [Mycena sanguinolenta]